MPPIDLGSIDKNMKVINKLTEEDLVFHDVREEPFSVYGLYDYKTGHEFMRMPVDVATATNQGVHDLNYCTAGGRVRFSTDSRYVAIHANMRYMWHMDHMPMTGSAGFDIFVDDPESNTSYFQGTFRPGINEADAYESIHYFPTRKMRHFTINFPTYSGVNDLFIGLQKDAAVGSGARYRDIPPMVFYGSSITQGACSSRPGNAYQAILSRRLNIDHVNLGFSGSACGEDAICDYMATLPMSIFISDYDYNAPSVEHLKNTHEKLYRKIREKNPTVPYIMLSRPSAGAASYETICLRREIVFETFMKARKEGDKNVFYIDGESIFRGRDADAATVDDCHPNDYGFILMADAIEAEILRIFTMPYSKGN